MAKLFNVFYLITLVVIIAAFIIPYAHSQAVSACNEVCSRSAPERDSCCRAHGYGGSSGCVRDLMRCHP